MPNLVNELIVRELTDEFGAAEGLLLVAFGGLTVKETEKVRGELADKGVKFRLVRNNLARRVLKEQGLEFPEEALLGNTGIAYGDAEAPILAAKILTEKELKKTGKVTLKASLLEGQVLDAVKTTALADIPDRESLYAMLLGVISGPARSLAGVLNAVPSATARVLQARADSLQESEG